MAADLQDPTDHPLPRDPDQLARFIAHRRENLAATLDQLRFQARPDRVVRRAGRRTLTGARHAVRDENGRIRTDRVLAVAAATSAALALVVLAGHRCARRAPGGH